MSRLKKKYLEEVRPALQKKFALANPMKIPSLKKIVINMGIAEAAKDKNNIQDCVNDLTMLSGQKPIITKARKAISNFKLREGQPIGVMVTLRGVRMYDFLDRFCNIVTPRIRDFRGLPLGCDGRGNYTVGLEEQQVFPEVDLDKVKRSQGMHITFVTNAGAMGAENSDAMCVELLKLLGMPFGSEVRSRHSKKEKKRGPRREQRSPGKEQRSAKSAKTKG